MTMMVNRLPEAIISLLKYFATNGALKGYVVSDSEAVEFLYSKHQVAADAVDGAARVKCGTECAY